MNPTVVVAAVLVKDGRLLVAQRKPDASQALKWEFPGGKIEPGETPEAALSRELLEDLGIVTETGRIYDAKLHAYPEKTVLILFYKTRLIAGEAHALDANAFRWVTAEELHQLDFADADADTAMRLAISGFASDEPAFP